MAKPEFGFLQGDREHAFAMLCCESRKSGGIMLLILVIE
jgi:hypothetical protein